MSWLQEPYLGFDLETTGVDRYNDLPVSFAFVVGKGDHIERRLYKIVNPGIPISEKAMEIHGITEERAKKEGISIEEALGTIENTLLWASKQNIPLMGMNVSFDLTMVNEMLKKQDSSLIAKGWRGPIIDALELDHWQDKYRKGKRTLTDLCTLYGVSFDNAHNALADVEASIMVIKKLHKNIQ